MSSSESEAENDIQEDEENLKGEEDKEEREKNIPQQSSKTFAELGLNEVLVEACEKVGWRKPSRIHKRPGSSLESPRSDFSSRAPER